MQYNINLDNSNSPLSQLNLLFLDQNFTEIYPDNSNSPLKLELFSFPFRVRVNSRGSSVFMDMYV